MRTTPATGAGFRALDAAFAPRSNRCTVFCECTRAHCVERVELPAALYEEICGDDERFLVKAGHEELELDRIVAGADGYRVVVPDQARVGFAAAR